MKCPHCGEEIAVITAQEMGRRGGKATSERYGHGFYEEIGRRGGRKTSERYGAPFYEEIGHKAGQKVKRLIEAGKAALGE